MGPFNLPPWSLQGAADRSLVLFTLQWSPQKSALDQLMQAYTGVLPDSSGFFPNVPNCVAHYYAAWGTNILIAIAGVQTEDQAKDVYTGYLGDFFTSYSLQWNTTFKKYADIIYSHLAFPNGHPTGIYVMGHSAGGGTALMLTAQQTWNDVLAGTPNTTVFGAPKVAARNIVGGLGGFSRADYCAWAANDDPVPVVPPPVPYSWVTGWLPFSRQQNNTANSFVPQQFGKLIQPDLSITDGVLPLGVTPATVSDFGRWYSLIGQGVQSPHTISVYKSRLAASSALFPAPLPAPPLTPAPPAPPPVTPALTRAVLTAQRQQLTLNEQVQNAQIPSMPQGANFVAAREGGIWNVYYGGAFVASGPRRKTAQALARAGNEFLERLGRQGAVDSSVLVAQFIEYMSLANDSSSGIVPKLAPPL